MHKSIEQIPGPPSQAENEPPLSKDRQSFNIFSELVATHIPRHPFFKLVEYDSNNPLHQLKTTLIEVEPTDIDTIIETAEDFYPGFFENMVKPLLEEEKRELMEDIASRLKAGENIALITDHESLIDIIIATLALNVALAKRGLVDFKEQTLHTDLIASRTILCLETDNDSDSNKDSIPIAATIRPLGNQLFSVPDSERIRQSDISDDIAIANNRTIMRQLKELLDNSERGRIVALAAPGTVSQPYMKLDGGLHHIVIDTVSPKTAKLIKYLKTALPATVVLSGKNQTCIVGELTTIEEVFDVHEMMIKLAGTRQKATGVGTGYKLFDSRY